MKLRCIDFSSCVKLCRVPGEAPVSTHNCPTYRRSCTKTLQIRKARLTQPLLRLASRSQSPPKTSDDPETWRKHNQQTHTTYHPVSESELPRRVRYQEGVAEEKGSSENGLTGIITHVLEEGEIRERITHRGNSV